MSRSITERAAAVLTMLLAGACRFGGPSGDPTAYGDMGADAAETGGRSGDAASETGGTGASVESGSPFDGAIDATFDAGLDASGGALDASVDGDASVIDAHEAGNDDAGGDSADGAAPACVPAFTSAVCDPVCNTGCPALFRCDLADAPRTGVCFGSLLSTTAEGMACTRSALSDACLASLTCIDGACRRLCYRDADCVVSGTCCNTDIATDGGASGYRRCAPCGP